ncbi:tetratricopeptide repeat protein [Luteibaculum oceani]|uniref:Tetratricopeptide repeat protein n=1 Tax=Luteibaculum oceani TaxID=1294296 RepID=A0A5C6UWP2_9FLAO|nr:tetratricopeptide repeat protein [Luteibaculum oceani]TXC77084.1 tetratricopeptide repeat protein [Luteibaculum oceani]
MQYSDDFNQADELQSILNRFEDMLRNREEVFFDVEEIELMVDHFIENQNNNRAKKAIAIGCSQHPASIELKIKEAEVLLSSGKSTKALDSLLKLANIERFNPDLLLLIGGIYSRQKNHTEAINFFKRAMKCCDKADKLDILFDIGLEYEYSGKFETALEIFKEILLKSPGNDAVGYELLFCFAELEKNKEAISFFREFVDENPYSFLGWYNLGICYSKEQEFNNAARAFDFCILIEPQVSLPYYQKAFMFLELNEYDKALETYLDCLENDEGSSVLHTYIGECQEKLEQYEDAMVSYTKAIEIDDNNPDAWLGIGVVQDLMGHTVNALPYLKKATEINSGSDYNLVYCEALCKLEMYDEAEVVYKEMEKHEEKNTAFWLDYSNLISLKYGIEAALVLLDDIYGKFPNVSFLYRKAAFLYKFGMFKEAELILEAAVEEDSSRVDEFLEYYPEGKTIGLLSEFIDLQQKF